MASAPVRRYELLSREQVKPSFRNMSCIAIGLVCVKMVSGLMQCRRPRVTTIERDGLVCIRAMTYILAIRILEGLRIWTKTFFVS